MLVVRKYCYLSFDEFGPENRIETKRKGDCETGTGRAFVFFLWFERMKFMNESRHWNWKIVKFWEIHSWPRLDHLTALENAFIHSLTEENCLFWTYATIRQHSALNGRFGSCPGSHRVEREWMAHAVLFGIYFYQFIRENAGAHSRGCNSNYSHRSCNAHIYIHTIDHHQD